MLTLQGIKAAFTRAGFQLRHTSKDGGRVRSYYFERGEAQVRVSDHYLGCTVYGEQQGTRFSHDFVLETLADKATGADLVAAVEDDDVYELIITGYCPADPEWEDELAELRG